MSGDGVDTKGHLWLATKNNAFTNSSLIIWYVDADFMIKNLFWC